MSDWNGVEGVILDAVGTLIEPRPSVAEAYRRAALRQGVDLDVGLVRGRFREHFGTDEVDEARGPLATDEATERRRWRRIVSACLPEIPDPDRAFDELWVHFGDPSSWVAFEDVGPGLDRLATLGLMVGIGSNFDARLRRVLGGLGPFRGRSIPLAVSSEVGRRKPHRLFYLAACESIGLIPGRVLFAGDDPRNDVAGPIEAGARAVLLDRRGESPDGSRSLLDLADRLAPG